MTRWRTPRRTGFLTTLKMIYKGKEIDPKSPREAIDLGIALVPEDRKRHGAMLGVSIKNNINMPIYERNSRFSVIDEKKEQEIAEKYRNNMAIKTPNLNQLIKNLSGGNQQKVILAREITDQAGLIVASQPTRGLDIGATEFVHQELLKQKSQGKSVVLISADLDELLSLSDRIAVMFAGKIVGILDRAEADVFKIGLLMGGVTGEEAAVAERQEAAEPEAARPENARASAEKQETVGPDGCRNQPAAAGGQSRKGGDVA